ncbi:hypothetical protein [Tuwongella immobilis]|uniref:Uncharacterized protein n=1 Tax=Tuwongella immobilis TaxID=692036 RepID=A0A6C2YT41_9BACT|nr:hypothetical protein [Tuwongella immobilis]VIP04564.1 unnamed protein product [Tuwongella immobilis]VTS06489.1 unnamed protein product [Tuwongella immobilis]
MIQLNLSRGPYGIAVAEVPSEYQLLGEFLTSEASCTDSWVFSEFARLLREISSNALENDQMSGDAYTVFANRSSVTITFQYDDGPPPVTVSLSEMQDLLDRWNELLETNGYTGEE